MRTHSTGSCDNWDSNHLWHARIVLRCDMNFLFMKANTTYADTVDEKVLPISMAGQANHAGYAEQYFKIQCSTCMHNGSLLQSTQRASRVRSHDTD